MEGSRPLRVPAWARGSVARNMSSLYAIRMAMSLLPLISIPYVVRVLGPFGYGTFAFGQGLIAYFALFTDYGFNLAATRRISACRDDAGVVARIASATLAAKLLLTAGGLVLLLLLTMLPKLADARAVILLLYGNVVGNALFPHWLYEGQERMVVSSVLVVAGMAAATAGIFVVVRDPGDYVALAGLWGGSSVLVGVIGLAAGLRLFHVRLVRPPAAEVWEALRKGALLSASAGSTTLYTSGNAFLLGLVAPREVVGFYTAGEKVVRAIQALVHPVQQALYPRVSLLAMSSRDSALELGRRLLQWTGGLGLALSVLLFAGAPTAVRLVLGPDFAPTVQVIRILAPLPLIVAISSTLTLQVMVPFGRDRALVRILLLSGLTNVVMALLLASAWLETGMAVAVVLTEMLVAGWVATYLRSQDLALIRLSPLRAAWTTLWRPTR